MTTHGADEADGQVKDPPPDDTSARGKRLNDASRRIKDAADKLAERIKLPGSGARSLGTPQR